MISRLYGLGAGFEILRVAWTLLCRERGEGGVHAEDSRHTAQRKREREREKHTSNVWVA